jgi:5-methylcytosine-specific restriction endonuclease McrA
MTYAEQIKTPIWQMKRLKILERDRFQCQKCGSTSKELHVHHLVYIKGNSIYDYKDSELITLCVDCHKYETEHLGESCKLLLYNVRTSGLLSDEISELADYHKQRKVRL